MRSLSGRARFVLRYGSEVCAMARRQDRRVCRSRRLRGVHRAEGAGIPIRISPTNGRAVEALMLEKIRVVLAGAMLIAAGGACGESHTTTAPGEPKVTFAGYPGFDIGVYPGDAALTAWRYPTSPYHWVGYYLTAPCHRDATWIGQYQKVTARGWGTAVLY